MVVLLVVVFCVFSHVAPAVIVSINPLLSLPGIVSGFSVVAVQLLLQLNSCRVDFATFVVVVFGDVIIICCCCSACC